MSQAAVQVWQKATLTLKTATGGSSTYTLTNRQIPSDPTHYALIRGISGIGQRMGDVLPQAESGTISIDCSPGSFGTERRFCDLFQRESPIDQEIVVSIAQTNNADDDPTDNWVQIFKGTMRTVRISPDGERCEISVDSARLPKKYLTRAIDLVSTPLAPASSVGKNLPIVLGQGIEVPAILFDATPSAPYWAYATNFAQTFTVGGVTQIYAQDHKGKFVAISSAASTSAVMFGNTPSGPVNGGTVIDPKKEYAQVFSATGGGIVTSVTFEWYNVSGAAHTSEEIIISLYAADGNELSSIVAGRLPGTLLGTARFVPSQSGAGSKSSQASFDKPVVLESGKSYYFGVTRRTASPTDTSITFSRAAVPTSVNWFERSFDGSASSAQPQGWNYSTVTNGNIYVELFGVQVQDTNAPAGTPNSDGFLLAYISALHRAAASGQTSPDLDGINFVLKINGLRDDGSGTITGSASAYIQAAKYVTNLLDRTWNGSAWVAGQFDSSKFTGAHSPIDNLASPASPLLRYVQGRTEGRQTWESVMRAICLQTGARIALTNSTSAGKNYGVWGWGNRISTSATITDEDSDVINVEIRGTESIINHARFYYDNRLQSADVTKISAEGNFSQFASMIDWYDGANYFATDLAHNSRTVYGDRPNRDQGYSWVLDTASAENMAKFLLGWFAFPHWYVELECPLYKYRALEILDVIEILHPALPAYFGTSPSSTLPNFDGQLVDLFQGHYPKRAERYRAQIEGKQFVDLDKFPKVRINARLLINPGDPT